MRSITVVSLVVLLAASAHAQPVPADARTWVLHGHVEPATARLPMTSRVELREVDGRLAMRRVWTLTRDGAQRRFEAEARTVEQPVAGHYHATFELPGATGLAGALAGGGAAAPTSIDLTLRVEADGSASEWTSIQAGSAAPEQSWTQGARLEADDLVDRPLATIVDNGPAAERYDIVFVPEGYTHDELPAYRAAVRAAVARLRETTPYREYWAYVNVHRLELVSPGGGVEAGRGGPTLFGTTLDNPLPGAKGVPCASGGRVKAAAARAPGADTVVVLCNDAFRSVAYFGYTLVSAWDWRCPDVVVHELGHTIGLLLDEYDENPASPFDFVVANGFVEGAIRWAGWGANITTRTRRGEVPWAYWLTPGAPLPTPDGSGHAVGLYVGANHMSTRWHRPSERCGMRDSGAPFCPVCREQLVLQLSEKASPLDVAREQVDLETVRLTLKSRIPGPARFTWRRGESNVVVGEGPTFTVTRRDSPWGTAELRCEVEDLTPWVRSDPRARATFVVRFEVRKGWAWDRGVKVTGPYRGR